MGEGEWPTTVRVRGVRQGGLVGARYRILERFVVPPGWDGTRTPGLRWRRQPEVDLYPRSARWGGFSAELVGVETVLGGGETIGEALRSLCTRLAHLVDHAQDPCSPVGVQRQAMRLRVWL